jgi:hypothetical protein
MLTPNVFVAGIGDPGIHSWDRPGARTSSVCSPDAFRARSLASAKFGFQSCYQIIADHSRQHCRSGLKGARARWFEIREIVNRFDDSLP